jgi:hypothetical protein
MTMSDPVKPEAPKMGVNQSLIVGRIDAMRTFEVQGKRTFETRVVQAAPDQYSSPTAVAVQSFNKLGGKDDDVRVLVHCVGYRDSYKTREGEVVQTARNVFRAVE